jgi:TetR/AcrR family transcriptional regulator, tetracycline repressor protein
MSEPRQARPRLHRDAVLRAALALGDREGAGAISLRRVAAELGVTPMALYRYVESKEALQDALLDLAYGEVELSDSRAQEWWDGLAAIAHAVRRVLIAHPAAAAIATTRPGAGPNAMRIVERVLELLIGAGLETQAAVEVQTAFIRFVVAMAALEAGLLPEPSAEERRQRALRARFELESLPPDEYPNLIAAAPHIATPFEPERTFDQALGLLKAGIASRLPRRPRTR